MTNEEIEKTMQFILEQQAQFAANQQQLGDRVSRLETNMAEMAQSQTHMNEVIADMGRAQTHMNEVVAVMADTHRHTEEKLDAFIGVLERYISEGRNGRGSGRDAT
jgi:3-phenylpropionate/cinnamic acid dioxygenase small subunit